MQQVVASSPQSRPTSVVESDLEPTPTNTPTPQVGGSDKVLNSSGGLFLVLGPAPVEPMIVHPGAVIAMLHLIPAIQCDDNPKVEQV